MVTMVIHAHGTIWKEKVNLRGRGNKHAPKIIKLLEAVMGPKVVAIITALVIRNWTIWSLRKITEWSRWQN